VREKSGDGYSTESKMVDDEVGKCRLTTAEAPRSCALSMSQAGYYIVTASTRDAKGRLVRAAIAYYGIGAGEAFFGDADDRTIELVPNKKAYQVGDKAKILVKSPYKNAEALVTVERAGIYSKERVRLSGPTPTITVPITADLRPNAYVAVHLLKPQTGAGELRSTTSSKFPFASRVTRNTG
jgi:uncharacterized protein YfaS (alpha-2-macroglobulin family)